MGFRGLGLFRVLRTMGLFGSGFFKELYDFFFCCTVYRAWAL